MRPTRRYFFRGSFSAPRRALHPANDKKAQGLRPGLRPGQAEDTGGRGVRDLDCAATYSTPARAILSMSSTPPRPRSKPAVMAAVRS